MTKRIVVLHRGFVAVGDVTVEGDEVRIDNGGIVRRWGTTAGLGELADKGPLSKTVIDPAKAPIRVHRLGVVFSIDCNAAAWSSP